MLYTTKSLTAVIIITASFLNITAKAQVKLKAISFSIGSFVNTNYLPNPKIDIAKSFPNSTYNKAPFKDSMVNDYNMYNFYNPSFKADISLSLKKYKHFESEFRFGIGNFTKDYNRSQNYTYETRLDTLISQQTGQKLYLDSLNTSYRAYNINSRNLLLDAAYIINTNQNKRFSFYSGLGIRQSINIGNSLGTYVYTNGSYNYIINNGGYSVSTSTTYFNEQDISLSKSDYKMYFTQLYLPLGTQLRLSQKNTYFKHCYLFVETCPTITIANTNGVNKTFTNVSGFTGFRIKF